MLYFPESILRLHIGATGDGIRVGVIDSGWDRTQSDSRVEPGIGLVRDDDELVLGWSDDDGDRVGHGTACADLILRVAPNVRIVPIRVFGGRLETSLRPLQVAMQWAAHRVDVINVSLGTALQYHAAALESMCNYVRRQGAVIVAAEHPRGIPSFPSAFESTIAVTAGQGLGLGRGSRQMVASGIHHGVRWLGGQRTTVFGTSFAAPVITGAVSLLLERYPRTPPAELPKLLHQFLPDQSCVADRSQ